MEMFSPIREQDEHNAGKEKEKTQMVRGTQTQYKEKGIVQALVFCLKYSEEQYQS